MGGRRCLLVLALGLAAFAARALWPTGVLFGWDQARDVLAAREILAGRPVLAGPSIGAGFLHLGPLQFYLVALGLLPRNDPLDARLFLAFVAALGTPFLFFAWRPLLGAGAAAAAAFLLAVHPGALVVERIPWNPALVAPTLGLFVWALLRAGGPRPAAGVFGAWVGAALLPHAHGAAAFLVPLLLLVLRDGRRSPTPRAGLLGFAAAAALTLPWAIPETIRFVRVGSPAPEAILGPGVVRRPETWRAAPVVFLDALLPERQAVRLLAAGPASLRPWAEAAGAAFGVLVLLGLLVAWRRLPRRAALLLSSCALLPPAFLVFVVPYNVYFHYLAPTFAARCVLSVLGATRLRPVASPPGALLLWAVACLLPAAYALAAFHGEWRQGLVTWRLEASDLRRKAPPTPKPPVRFPTLGARRELTRALKRHWGMTRDAVAQSLYGPWWATLLDDGGFWLAEAWREGDEGGRQPAGGRLVVLHREDAGPHPARPQVLATHPVGPFCLYRLRTVLGARWFFRWPDRLPGVWVPLAPWVPRRPLPTGALGVERLDLRTLLLVPDPPPRKLHLLLSLTVGWRWTTVSVDGRPLLPAAPAPAGPGYPFCRYVWGRPAPGRHTLLLRGRREATGGDVNLDLYDIWE